MSRISFGGTSRAIHSGFEPGAKNADANFFCEPLAIAPLPKFGAIKGPEMRSSSNLTVL